MGDKLRRAFLKIGNSEVALLYRGKSRTWPSSDKAPSGIFRNLDEVHVISVVPSVTKRLKAQAETEACRFILHKNPSKMAYRKGLGADRAWNVEAARQIFKTSAILILDLGTAWTAEFILRGEHLGGWIAAGPRLLSRALHSGTALLPQVDARRTRADLRPGRSTRACLGEGQRAQLEGWLTQAILLERKLARGQRIQIILTGGASHALMRQTWLRAVMRTHGPAQLKWLPNLALRGLESFVQNKS